MLPLYHGEQALWILLRFPCMCPANRVEGVAPALGLAHDVTSDHSVSFAGFRYLQVPHVGYRSRPCISGRLKKAPFFFFFFYTRAFGNNRIPCACANYDVLESSARRSVLGPRTVFWSPKQVCTIFNTSQCGAMSCPFRARKRWRLSSNPALDHATGAVCLVVLGIQLLRRFSPMPTSGEFCWQTRNTNWHDSSARSQLVSLGAWIPL